MSSKTPIDWAPVKSPLDQIGDHGILAVTTNPALCEAWTPKSRGKKPAQAGFFMSEGDVWGEANADKAHTLVGVHKPQAKPK